jgi:hypothetical protein
VIGRERPPAVSYRRGPFAFVGLCGSYFKTFELKSIINFYSDSNFSVLHLEI